jgi:signal transduction histidine kinase
VTLALRLRSAAEPSSGQAELGTEIAGVAAELMGVIDDLREISRGIHPAILSKAGLRPALRALGRRSAVPVELDVRVDGRLPEPVEVGAYYVVSEMLANAAKHARASMIQVGAETSGGTLRVRVHDDGIRGAGLRTAGAEGPYRGARRDVLRVQPGGPRHHGVLPASGQCRRRAIAHRNGRMIRRTSDRATL